MPNCASPAPRAHVQIRRFVVLAAAVLLVATFARPAAAADPERVTVGTYVNQVYGLDLKANQFNVDFYVWFRWKNDELKPLDSFELANGRITSKAGAVKKKLPDGTNYASCRVVATVTRFFDLRRYPLDDQSLELAIEDNEHEVAEAVYVADPSNSGVSPAVAVPGWAVGPVEQSVRVQDYRTNYGDPTLSSAGSSYSRYVAAVPLLRSGHWRLLKVFFGLFVATLVSLLAFWVRPKDTGPRMSLAIGSLFAAAASSFALNAQLPDTAYLTMTERMVIVTFAMILFSTGATTLSLNLLYRGKDAWVAKVDRVGGILAPALFAMLLYFYVL